MTFIPDIVFEKVINSIFSGIPAQIPVSIGNQIFAHLTVNSVINTLSCSSRCIKHVSNSNLFLNRNSNSPLVEFESAIPNAE